MSISPVSRGQNGPATGGFAVVPNDQQPLSSPTRALMVGTLGDVHVEFLDGSQATLPGLVPGVVYGFHLRRVFATGTTAAGLVGLS